MVAQLLHEPHPIVGCAEQVSAAIAKVADVQPVYMSAEDKRAAVVALEDAERRLAELRLRVLAASGDVAEQGGYRDAGAWAAGLTCADGGPARSELRLAEALDRRWRAVAAGMARGQVSMAQAHAVAEVLDALPASLGAELRAQAEEQLVHYCAEFRPAQLRRLGRRLLDLVAPEIAEAEEARRLELEEQHARGKTSLRSKGIGEGLARTVIVHPVLERDRLLTYLDAYTSPRHDDTTTSPVVGAEADRIPLHRKRGQAFGALLEHLDPTRLPEHGGTATTVMVTIPIDHLTKELATAGMIDADLGLGANMSAAQARRLACTADIVPTVLGGEGEILDLGRSRRLFSRAQRRALRLRDKRCRAEGCTIPATWTEAHHLKPWSEGGPTDLAHGICYCSWHHHRAHDPRFEAVPLPDGDTCFARRR